MKPFAKSEQKIVTVTIDENGDVLFLKSDSNDIFLELGNVVTKRASHVEPAPRYDRWLFHTLRILFGNTGRVAEWTRGWKTLWRVNTRPVGGPIIRYKHVPEFSLYLRRSIPEQIVTWSDRKLAIDAEIKFVNNIFLNGGTR